MNKTELVAKVAEQAQMSKERAGAAINAMTEVIAAALHDGEKVQIVGFGTFEPRVRAARTGVNPRTSEKIQIAQTIIPAFKAGSAMKAAVRG